MANASAHDPARPPAEEQKLASEKPSSLGIIAGGGALPAAIAGAAISQGRAVHVLAFHQTADDAIFRFPHTVIRWGQIGKIFRTLRQQGCQEVVLVGSLKRPKLGAIRPDLGLFTNLPAILKLTRGGDDSVLKRIVRLFEYKGFRVLGAHDIAPHLVAPEGVLTRAQPNTSDWQDIRLGWKVVQALGSLDVGQAAAVSRGYVLTVEAAEGTDEMLRRCRALHQWGLKQASGVLIKRPKPGQELRIDMPAIGPNTVMLAVDAGLRGIAVEYGKVLLAEPQKLVETADAKGVFIIGVAGEIA